MTNERTAKHVATFTVPAVIDTSDVKKEWLYSGLTFVVTDQADPFLVRYITSIVRS